MDSSQHQQKASPAPSATPKSRSGQSTPLQQHQQKRPLNEDLPRDNEYEEQLR